MALFIMSADRKIRADGPHTELFHLPLFQCRDGRTSQKVARCRRKANGLEKQINDVCSTLNALHFARAGRHLQRCHPTQKGARQKFPTTLLLTSNLLPFIEIRIVRKFVSMLLFVNPSRMPKSLKKRQSIRAKTRTLTPCGPIIPSHFLIAGAHYLSDRLIGGESSKHL